MLSLSPAKIMVVLVIALIVLGPEKLPGMARQLGAAWGAVRKMRTRLETEVRGSFPDLPPAHEVARAVRSPLAFLDRLADEHERTLEAPGAGPAAANPEAKRAPPADDGGGFPSSDPTSSEPMPSETTPSKPMPSETSTAGTTTAGTTASEFPTPPAELGCSGGDPDMN